MECIFAGEQKKKLMKKRNEKNEEFIPIGRSGEMKLVKNKITKQQEF